MKSENQHWDVIVAGAGPAGFAAAAATGRATASATAKAVQSSRAGFACVSTKRLHGSIREDRLWYQTAFGTKRTQDAYEH